MVVCAAKPNVLAQISVDQHGVFAGDLVLKALPDGRNMEVLSTFSYTDSQGHTLTADKGFVSDGASIPRAAWSIIGGPWDGPYRNAAVIHDVGCVSHKYTWQDTDRIFLEAMLDSGVARVQALTMYYAVLVGGPRWAVVSVNKAKSSNEVDHEVASELSRLSKIQRSEAVVESRKLQTLGSQKQTEYSASIYVPLPKVEITEEQLKSVQQELTARSQKGEYVPAEEIERRASEYVQNNHPE